MLRGQAPGTILRSLAGVCPPSTEGGVMGQIQACAVDCGLQRGSRGRGAQAAGRPGRVLSSGGEEAASLHRLSGPPSTLQDSLLPSRGECRTHSPSPPRWRLGSLREQPQDSHWAMTLPDSGDVTGWTPHSSQEQSRDLAVKGPQ